MKLASVLTAALALSLTACASSPEAPPAENRGGLFGFGAKAEPNSGPCPLMGVLNDNSRLVAFADPAVQSAATVTWTAEMRGVKGLCRYVGSDPIKMNLTIDMAFGRGQAAPGSSHTYRYFVTVTRTNSAVLQREVFEVPVNFGSNDRMAGSETIAEITIPRANDTISGANFEVLVGFELTPEQLEFNRSGKRFRVNAGG